MNSSRNASAAQTVLGIDLGVASIGWALVSLSEGRPAGLTAAGVRAFPAGVKDGLADSITAGSEESSAAARREARLRRRQLARRRHRLTALALALQHAGLLPPGDLESGDALMQYFERLDRDLFAADARNANPHLLPYRLRARALDEKLTPYEFGRALYHLAHRRGFLSNRRVKPKPAGVKESDEEKEEGVVNTTISDLACAMRDAGARTLGEYLSRLDPEQQRLRGQGRYLGRKMIEGEFEQMWAAQLAHHPDLLTPKLKRRLHRAIFYQRPLKSQRHLLGKCELEKGSRRAPLACLDAQRFRLLQKVNDLTIHPPEGEAVPLTPDQRAILVRALEDEGDRKFGIIRKLLKPPKGSKFNLEFEGEKAIIGNRTARKLRDIFGDQRWDAMPAEQRDAVVTDLLSIQNADALKRLGGKRWGLDHEAAGRLAAVALESDYCNLSRKALAKVLPLMEAGMQYAKARKQLWGDEPGPAAVDMLPALTDCTIAVRNPIVQRALTELRKVVNAIAREHGRPDFIRIELAREFKKNRKERDRIHKNNIANREARLEAAEQIAREQGIPVEAQSRRDREKWLLWKECGGRCPYTGRTISMDALFGDHPQFDIEHIIPLPRCLDDSFMNKTLCAVEKNSEKGNRTPWEAYHGTPQWDDIIQRVSEFRGSGRGPKLERFQMDTDDVRNMDDFVTQQMNDTRYASRLATEYLGLLFGAGKTGVDPAGRKRVEATRGGVTAYLRSEWGLNAILGAGEKLRDDHRQHAIDAVVVALTDAGSIKRLSDAAEHAPQFHRRRFAPMEPPWEGFLDQVRDAIGHMVVSHRVSRTIAGALHEETNYGRPRQGEVHVRKPLASLKAKDIPDIVDRAVRDAVQAKLAELGQPDPGKAFKSDANHPVLRAKDGRLIPIHKVRLRTDVSPTVIGHGASERHVKLGSNHHVEIIETTDRKGNPKWEGKVVSRLEAQKRVRNRQPVIQRDHGPAKTFKFSLAGGEIIELNTEESKRQICVVRTISVTRKGYPGLEFVGISDARKKGTKAEKGTIKGEGAWYTAAIDALRKRGCCKVVVTPLGVVRTAND